MVIVEDTYCEAFEGLVVQLMVTAQDEEFLTRAANAFTALPSTVFGDAEGGIVRWLSKDETIDGRIGAIVQLWVTGTGKKATAKFYDQLGRRMRQGILVVPTTAVFDHFPNKTELKLHLSSMAEFIVLSSISFKFLPNNLLNKNNSLFSNLTPEFNLSNAFLKLGLKTSFATVESTKNSFHL